MIANYTFLIGTQLTKGKNAFLIMNQFSFQGSTAQEVKIESALDVTIHSGTHELSLADFLDGCANVANETSSIVRSTLEDFDKKAVSVNDQDIQKIDVTAPEAPEKHGKKIDQTLLPNYHLGTC